MILYMLLSIQNNSLFKDLPNPKISMSAIALHFKGVSCVKRLSLLSFHIGDESLLFAIALRGLKYNICFDPILIPNSLHPDPPWSVARVVSGMDWDGDTQPSP